MIRPATEIDAPAVAAIYDPFCASTVISFEVVAPSVEEMAGRIRATTAQFPWIVLEDGGRVAGYAYASRHSERAAYQWSVNTAVYVSPSHHRRGVGRALYRTLFDLLRELGYYKAYAGITLPNEASVGLHAAVGFTPVGVYKGVGYKQGAWRDVAWYQLALRPEQSDPAVPRPVSALTASTWTNAAAAGLTHYRRA